MIEGAQLVTQRALNRASLARQLLLERSNLAAYDAVERLVGLQAQIPNVPYLALWSRLKDFDPHEVGCLLEQRRVVRAVLMRTTVHLVTADDAVTLRPLMQPVMARTFGSTSWGQALRGQDVNAIVEKGRQLITEEPRSRAQLGPLLQEIWPDRDPQGMAMAVSYLEPNVQVTPRGVWGRSGQAVLTSLDAWLGRELATKPSLDDMVCRYLTAFGPATVNDIQAWCGLTKLREVTDRLHKELRRFRTEAGAELVDVPDGPLPAEDIEAPPRFLPEYDNALLGYADRSRFSAQDADHVWLQGGPGGYVGSVLVDGVVSATWALRRTEGKAVMEVRASVPLSLAERGRVQDEAHALMPFVVPGDDHDIRWTGAGARR